jgi:hypothetical protein
LTLLRDGINRANGQEGAVVVTVDIAKAFECHILPSSMLSLQRVSTRFAGMISNMCRGVTSNYPNGQVVANNRALNRLLSNIVIDPPLKVWTTMNEG